MNLAFAFSAYLNFNVLLVVATVALILVTRLWIFSAREELKLHYFVMSLLIGFSFLQMVMPSPRFFSAPAKVWSGSTFQDVEFKNSNTPEPMIKVPLLTKQAVPTDTAGALSLGLLISLMAMGVFFMARDLNQVWQIRRRSFLIRKVGHVKVFVSDTVAVPFSFWSPLGAYVVIPSKLLSQRTDFKIALKHELQHHRQHDTQWVYVLWILKWLCFFNPLVHVLHRRVSEIQEFACDEALVDLKVDSQDYARCLIQVAQTAIEQKRIPVCATGLSFLIERHILKRRIEKMLTTSTTRTGRSVSLVMGLCLALGLGATAFAAKGLVQDRRVTMEQAQSMVTRAQGKSEFPVVMNDLVLKELNRFLGTADGRDFMKSALERLERHRMSVDLYLKKYRMPDELMAIPIIESGYQNLPERANPVTNAAGLWQFIRSTARNYGLKVDGQQDQRLDVGLNTDAAMRYLQANHLRFKDWHLSVLAYNIGENAVQKKMNEHSTRDAWDLTRTIQGEGGTYLPRLMAAIIIMNNPDSVE